MATQSPALSSFLPEFTGGLLAEREIHPRARIIAKQAAELLPGTAVAVYLLEDGPPQIWSHKASVGEINVTDPAIACDAGLLGELYRRREPLIFSGSSLRREDYAHVHARRTISSVACYPLLLGEALIAAVEIVSFDRELAPGELGVLDPAAQYAALALNAAVSYENERNAQFKTINRLTQLYDLERVFNSTLQMDQLLPIITAKVEEILEVQAVNLWMVQEEDLVLMHRSGADPTTRVGETQASGQGIAAGVADTGKAIYFRDPRDARIVARNEKRDEKAPGAPVRSVIAVPIMSQGSLVGVLETVNRLDGRPFDEDDAFFLSTISLTAASALHNASLLEAERKIEILETLVKVSQEITSTLNLDRVLQVVVNGPQKIMKYDRAAVALDQAGRVQLKAVSGKPEVNLSDPSTRRLAELLQWAAISDSDIHVTQDKNEIHADREESRLKFQEYFAATGNRGWYSIPLADDQGTLGVLVFESRDPDFLSDVHFEFIKVLAGQATVAVRNASLYSELPLIGVLEPMVHRKRQFMRLDRAKQAQIIAAAVAVVLLLSFVPIPMRVTGEATVAPQHSAQINADVEGVIGKVNFREGDHVTRNAVLAEMEDWDYRSALAAAEAKHNAAAAAMNRALASNDGAEAGIQRVQAEYWQAESDHARQRLERTRLRSPIDGVVATARVEDMAGHKLLVGDPFAQIVDASHASVDVAIDASDVPLVKAGDEAAVKVEGYPTHRFTGTVTVVSPMSVAELDRRVFYARVDVPNAEGLLHPGMQGRGKVSVGWHAAGYVFFRDIGMWAWSKVWTWFGW